MDGALVHSDIIPVDNNMKIWQMKVTLKLNMFACVILTKDNLVKNNWHGSTKFYFPHIRRQLNTYCSSAKLHVLCGQPSI